MADVIDFNDDTGTKGALEQALAWVEVAKEGFEESSIDYVALDGVTKALEAVYVGYIQRKELESLGVEPVDRTYRKFDLV